MLTSCDGVELERGVGHEVCREVGREVCREVCRRQITLAQAEIGRFCGLMGCDGALYQGGTNLDVSGLWVAAGVEGAGV